MLKYVSVQEQIKQYQQSLVKKRTKFEKHMQRMVVDQLEKIEVLQELFERFFGTKNSFALLDSKTFSKTEKYL